MKGKSGFSLMEMMTVLAIISILTAIATPNVLKWAATQQFNSAVREIQATIQSMRLAAVKENSEAVITFTNGANSYQTDQWKRGSDTRKVRTVDLPAGVSISPNFVLRFNSRGMATPGTITITGASGESLDITVSPTGSSRIG